MSAADLVGGYAPGEWPASEADAKKGHESGHVGTRTELSPHQGGLGLGGQGPGCDRVAVAPEPARLPCQNRNNSTEPLKKRRRGYRFTPLGFDNLAKDSNDLIWRKERPGHHIMLDGQPLTTADRKRSFILRNHAESFLRYAGRNHTLFFTTSDKDNVNPKEYARRWNSLLAHESDWITGFLRVLEPQKNGRPHFHNLVAVAFDTKPDDFDWDAFDLANEAYRAKDWELFRKMRARYKASAAPQLVALWKWGREKMPLYGLGRCEILPIRKQGAISHYIGKYLDKGMTHKIDDWKGVRRFETDRRASMQWKRCGSKFSWSGIHEEKGTGKIILGGAYQWRQRVGQLAFALGLPCDGDITAIKHVLGSRWAYQLRGVMITGEQTEWVETLEVLRSVYGKS